MHSYNTRNSSQLRATKSHTISIITIVSVSGLILWNSLPRNNQESASLSSFKSTLFKFTVKVGSFGEIVLSNLIVLRKTETDLAMNSPYTQGRIQPDQCYMNSPYTQGRVQPDQCYMNSPYTKGRVQPDQWYMNSPHTQGRVQPDQCYMNSPYTQRRVQPDQCYMNSPYTQRRVQPEKCYFTVQITGINFECSL